MAATIKRRRTDFYCHRCKRPLHYSRGLKGHKDTVSAQVAGVQTHWRHDQCGGTAEPGQA